MTRKGLTLVLLALACFAMPAVLPADVLLIEEVRQAGTMNVPPNGMDKADVRAQFGEPATVHAAVGNPPITRWDYDKWSVYFEYDLVLFTVIHKEAVKKQPAG